MEEDFDSVYVTDFSEENYTAALVKKAKEVNNAFVIDASVFNDGRDIRLLMADIEATRKKMFSVIPVAQLDKCFSEEIDVLNSLCSHVKFRHYDFSDIENIVQEFQQLIDINFNIGNLKCHWRIRSPLMKEREEKIASEFADLLDSMDWSSELW